jgi:hypothetical protein
VDVERLPSFSPHPSCPSPRSPPPPLLTVRSPIYSIRTLSPITLLVVPPFLPIERPSTVTLLPSPSCDVDMCAPSSLSSSPSSLSAPLSPLTSTLPPPPITPPHPSTPSASLSPLSTQPISRVSEAVSVSPLPLPAVTVTSPPLSLPAPSSSSTPPSSSRVSGEKRGKESSDEDGEEKKAEVAATQAMIEEYNLLKSKRQKLKERKERAKQRMAEVDLRPLLSDEVEKQRVWLLNGLNPTPDEIDRASRGHTGVHPALLELLRDVRLEDIFPLVPPEVMVEIRRLFLSPPTFTQHAVYAVCDAYIAAHCGRAP